MRRCGDCQLCCKLLPVRELAKGAGERCRFQKFHKGCTVYHRPSAGFPRACGLWNCAWLGGGEGTGNLSRPDRAHYVIDIAPDFVTLVQETGERIPIPVLQIWVDPAFPDAHKDKALRAYLEFRAVREGCAALIRYNNEDGFTLFPPAIAQDGRWHERHSAVKDKEHDVREIAEAIGGVVIDLGVRPCVRRE